MAAARGAYGARVRRYETDLLDEEWRLLEAWLPPDPGGGRRRTTDLRAVCDAIFYVLKTGCQWRLVPADFPPWSTVYHYFQRWKATSFWGEVHDFLRSLVRVQDGRSPEPTAGIIDSRTMKSSAQALDAVGYDGGKKVKGRKAHIMTDTMGTLLSVVVHRADIQDRDGAALVFKDIQDRFPPLDVVYADGGHQGTRAATACPSDLVVVKRTEPGFVVLAKRWIVERTFAWFTQNRRLVKDYEGFVDDAQRAQNAPVERFEAKKATAVASGHRRDLHPVGHDPPHAATDSAVKRLLVQPLITKGTLSAAEYVQDSLQTLERRGYLP